MDHSDTVKEKKVHHVHMLWGCERDKACQQVWTATYNGCLFGDVHEVAKGQPFCVAHGTFCECRVPRRDRNSTAALVMSSLIRYHRNLSYPSLREPVQDCECRSQARLFHPSSISAPGAPCQPFSRMGKGEGMDDPKFSTHNAMYAQMSRNTDIILLENVPECDLVTMMKHKLGKGWSIRAVKIDPRHFGCGCSRPRIYALGWKKSRVSWDNRFNFEEILSLLMATPRLKAEDYWFLSREPSTLTASEDWLWTLFGFRS